MVYSGPWLPALEASTIPLRYRSRRRYRYYFNCVSVYFPGNPITMTRTFTFWSVLFSLVVILSALTSSLAARCERYNFVIGKCMYVYCISVCIVYKLTNTFYMLVLNVCRVIWIVELHDTGNHGAPTHIVCNLLAHTLYEIVPQLLPAGYRFTKELTQNLDIGKKLKLQ